MTQMAQNQAFYSVRGGFYGLSWRAKLRTHADEYVRMEDWPLRVFNRVLNGCGRILFLHPYLGVTGGGKFVIVSFEKSSWRYSWGYTWGYIRTPIQTPIMSNLEIKSAFFEV